MAAGGMCCKLEDIENGTCPHDGGGGDGEEEEEEEEETEETEDKEDSVLNVETVSFEDFNEMDIRVGEIQKVEEHPDADRLYKVQIDVGEEVLQTCAGLKNHYEKREIEDRKVIVLANLEPSELRGETSECMMLAAENEEENVSLLETGKDMKVGSKIL